MVLYYHSLTHHCDLVTITDLYVADQKLGLSYRPLHSAVGLSRSHQPTGRGVQSIKAISSNHMYDLQAMEYQQLNSKRGTHLLIMYYFVSCACTQKKAKTSPLATAIKYNS